MLRRPVSLRRRVRRRSCIRPLKDEGLAKDFENGAEHNIDEILLAHAITSCEV